LDYGFTKNLIFSRWWWGRW